MGRSGFGQAPIAAGRAVPYQPWHRSGRGRSSNENRIGHNPSVAIHTRMSSFPMPSSYLSGRARSFGHAFRGLKVLLRTQHNARIHAAATVLVVAAGALARLSTVEWALIALAVAGVWAAEALNTSIEFLVDLASPERRPLAAEAKDVAAAAVLVAAIGSLLVGMLVFAPHVLSMFGK